MTPSSISCLAHWLWVQNRRSQPTISFTPAFRQALTMSHASTLVTASGFSTITCTLCAAAATAWLRWPLFGVAMTTASSFALSNRSR